MAAMLARSIPVACLALALWLVVPRAGVADPGTAAPQVTRVFLVRHAERYITGEDDPTLTPAGTRRAKALGRMLRGADVAMIFTTQFRRARATAESVSVWTKAPVEVVHSDSSAALARMVRQRFHGKTVVIIGHSDSLPHVIAELGWEGDQATESWSYEDLFLLELRTAEPPQLLHLYYGGSADTTGMTGMPKSKSP